MLLQQTEPAGKLIGEVLTVALAAHMTLASEIEPAHCISSVAIVSMTCQTIGFAAL